MNVNQAQILGRVTRDPEMKQLPSGAMVANFSIATNKFWKDKEGQKQESTEFHNIVFFGKTAEVAGNYVKKGSLLFVQGRLQTRSWEDKETGKKMYRTEIIGDMLQLPPKSMSGGEGATTGYTKPKIPKSKEEEEAMNGEVDTIEYPSEEINPDDIPF